MAEPLTYSVEEAAKVLGVGRGSTYELIHTGQLRHIQIGRGVVILRAGVREFLRLLSPQKTPGARKGKKKNTDKGGGAQETTYLITIRRLVNPAPRSGFQM